MSPSRFSDLDRFYGRSGGDRTAARPSLRFAELGGEEIETEFGSTLRLVRHYTWDRVPAGASWRRIQDDGWRPSQVNPGIQDQLALDRVVCLDIETTGLSLGAGTVAFLVGLASAHDEGICVHQYLMRDFSEEAAQQRALADALVGHELVVTYNGGRFDLPILRSRAIINRIDATWLDCPHLDLLHPVRAVWRRTWPDCRLSTAEARLLGVVRTADCEGWEVPMRYRQFLEEQSEAPLLDVLEHNAQDLISLLCMLAVVERLFAGEGHDFGLAQAEVIGLARALLARGRTGDSVNLLTQARAMGRLDGDYGQAMRTLVCLLKRKGEWDLARSIWTDLGRTPDRSDRFWACLEEAKFAEHRDRDFDRALAACGQAESELSSWADATHRPRLRQALQHRRERLLRRQKGGLSHPTNRPIT